MPLATLRLKRLFWARKRNKARSAKDLRRARAMVARYDRLIVSKQRANRKAAAAATGVTKFDGVPVAAVAVPYLSWARNHGWSGRLVSGWRDPRYSESLCYRMCGRPRCPGQCAGTSSNHVGTTKDRFAIDVSEYHQFARVIARCPLRPRIFNDLPNDRVHFSPSGK